jgi:hypothetical protein
MLGHHAGVTQLFNVVDLQHPTHHLLAPKLVERLKVEMSEPPVPAPASSSQRYRGVGPPPCGAHTTGCGLVDLTEETMVAVLDQEHPLDNLHTQATLIELVEANDEVLEGQDVVHPMEQLVLTGLSHEHNRPNAADLHGGLVAELDGARTLRSRSVKSPAHPIMWFMAPWLRYHPSSLSSLRKIYAQGLSIWSRAKEVSDNVG